MPALHIGGWYDIFLEGTIENFTRLAEPAPAMSMPGKIRNWSLAPGITCPGIRQVGAFDFGDEARNCVDALQILWLDKHLRGEGNQLDEELARRFVYHGRE